LQKDVFSSAYASAVYLKHVLKLPEDRSVYVVGMEGIQEELDAVGVRWCGGTVSVAPVRAMGRVAHAPTR
jgi:4-nitrophenyl phosphatase